MAFDKAYYESSRLRILSHEDSCIRCYSSGFFRMAFNFSPPIKDGYNKKALDVGCGLGYIPKFLKNLGYSVAGFDVSKYAITKAKELLPDCQFITHNIQESFPFTSRFNLITCFEVLEHLEKPIDAIANCYNALDSRGIFIATTPNKYCPIRILKRDTDATHISIKSIRAWTDIFEQFNWVSLKILCIQFVPFLIRMRKFIHFNLPIIGYSILIFAQKE